MRIIGGKFKNKKLNFPKNFKTRPLKDNVKENIFNILSHSSKIGVSIKNSNVLDLYAGSGSFGLECLSRDASNVFFVENNNDALKELKDNIKNLKSEKVSNCFPFDVLEFVKNFNLKLYKKGFNIIFLDPPYKDKNYIEVIKSIKIKDMLSKKYILLIHREMNSENEINKYINILEKRIYGRSEIFFGRFL